MRTFFVLIIFLLGALTAFSRAEDCEVSLIPDKIIQGRAFLIHVNTDTEIVPQGTFRNIKVHFIKGTKNNYIAIASIDLESQTGQFSVVVHCESIIKEAFIKVIPGDFRTQRLTLPEHLVTLSPDNLARAEREKARLEALWSIETERLWQGNFIMPLKGKLLSPFGVKRLINGKKRSPHSGIDIRGKKGTKIQAPNAGRVVLIDDQFFGGRTVVINHGQAIYSTFHHLSQIDVSTGQEVKKGEIFGRVGSTGRATGPHLHWGMKVLGQRVDPISVVTLPLY
jgi:murein DD-endopeptidase MepM/ murein hydrolase activator NlpD